MKKVEKLIKKKTVLITIGVLFSVFVSSASAALIGQKYVNNYEYKIYRTYYLYAPAGFTITGWDYTVHFSYGGGRDAGTYIDTTNNRLVISVYSGGYWKCGPWWCGHHPGIYRATYRIYGVIEVDIDIKPGSFPNSINPNSKGVIAVAILGSDILNVRDVDVTTLKFGPDEASPAHDLTDSVVYEEHIQDVDGDQIEDLVSHYRTQDTGIVPGDTSATLTGQTTGGIPISGTDSVRTVGRN